MAILPPARLPGKLSTIDGIAASVVALQQYNKTIYDALRVVVVRTDAAQLIQPLTQTISNPPTQAEVQAIQDKLNAIIAALALQVSGG